MSSDAWLRPLMGTTTRGEPAARAFMIALWHVARVLDADPGWHAWWQHSGVPTCELGIVAEGSLDHLRPTADIRQVDGKVRANFTCALPELDTDLPAELVELATAELTAMFGVIRVAMRMPELPPTPPLPEIPANARDLEVTTKSLPSLPRELEQQGYLTLSEIQEFFG
ncbi:hypothetical protein [Mangrovihabitans endophyticus]|uniref:Uncharacterized protein n=1 Tax=Mangrovihabitans endophyticus TaxID=1751298 RepID=A0A8J3FPS2_9ACTN|nr:hypothetical protein [Mangrovihabitans endophyticus]GGK97896.1 hypothetical protein GCM10012284_35150 [Mangrovihabitans endophyticus]